MSPEASLAIKETVRQYTGAFNRATKQAFPEGITNSVTIHRMRYYEERSQTQLPSQLVCSMVSKTHEALASVKTKQREYNAKVREEPNKFKPKTFKCPQSARQSIRYDRRSMKIDLKEGWATLITISDRQKVSFSLPKNFDRLREWKTCSAELCWDKRDRIFLHVVLEGQGKQFEDNGFVVGVDLGICRPAVMSTEDGKFNRFLGKREWKAIENRKYTYRCILKRKGTKPAKRQLKKMSGKVNRFRGDCDHVLSKQIVASVPTGTTLVFENLKDIRERCGRGKGKKQNQRMHRWSFARLFEYVDYKACLAGVKVVKVDPRNTSRRCPKCGFTKKANRKSQSQFKCHQCKFPLNADLVGSRNIAHKFAATSMLVADGCLSTSPLSPEA